MTLTPTQTVDQALRNARRRIRSARRKLRLGRGNREAQESILRFALESQRWWKARMK